jgi:hypothetical protein
LKLLREAVEFFHGKIKEPPSETTFGVHKTAKIYPLGVQILGNRDGTVESVEKD